MSHLQGRFGILFHQQHGHAFGIDLADDVKNHADDDGSQSQGRLVHHQHLGPAHEGTAHGEHLLLAARKRSGLLLVTLLQPGKQAEDVFQIGFDLCLVFA